MSEWKNNKLSYLVDIRVSNVDKKIYPIKKKVKLCNYMDAYSNDYITSIIRYSEGSADLNELNRFGLILNDVIITKDSETPEDIAVSSVVTEEIEDLVCGYHLAILRPREDRIHGPFLMHKLKLPQVQKYFFRMASGSTRYGLTIGGIENTSLSHPPLPHQRKIARILTKIDNIIEKTESALKKYKAIKQGMMHDLFTRGIDVKTGKLRPSYEDAPELYRETELGMIPKNWEVKNIYEILKNPIRDFGSFSMTNLINFVENGIPFLKTEVIQDGYIDFEDVSFITTDVHKLLYKSVVNKGDILYTKIGAIGRVAVYEGEIGECNSNAASAKIQVNTINYNNYFIALKLGSHRVTRDFEKSIISTPPRINLGEINAMNLELPQKHEQDIIAIKLEAIINKIRTEENHLKKMKKLKQGLMQDLLTGKKEVTPDPEDLEILLTGEERVRL